MAFSSVIKGCFGLLPCPYSHPCLFAYYLKTSPGALFAQVSSLVIFLQCTGSGSGSKFPCPPGLRSQNCIQSHPGPLFLPRAGSATLYFALPSMGCKAQLIGIMNKIMLLVEDHLGRCQLYPINLTWIRIHIQLPSLDPDP